MKAIELSKLYKKGTSKKMSPDDVMGVILALNYRRRKTVFQSGGAEFFQALRVC